MTFTQEKKVATPTSDNLLTIESVNYTNDYNTEIPSWIDKKHWEEWINSGVDNLIISRNVRSYHDSLEVDKLLNRNNKSRWEHSNNLIPCWAVSGVDPINGESTLLGIQVKPDTPTLNSNGKLQKYLGATGYPTTPLFLDTGIENYWKAVIDDKTKPIIITEGAKKAGCGLSNGYITISIPGVSTCRKDGKLHDSLKLFSGFGRTFYLCFDNDIMGKKPVQNALLGMAKVLCATGSQVMVIELPPGGLKGMDDFIYEKGKDEFDKLIENAKTIEEWRKELEALWLKQQLEDGEETKCKLKRQFEIIRDGWGEGLRLNQMQNQIELAGQQLNLDQIRLRMAWEFNEAVPIGDAQAIVEMLASLNAYHPVDDYLENVAQAYPYVDISILDNLASRYFGSDNELHNIYMKKTLLAAVARIKEPGCRLEAVPILVNPKQGIGKSTFWRNLFGDDWFSDDMGDANERDERMKLHQFWCLEWSEFENVYKRKDVSALKKFITTKTDSYRTPYSRTVKQYPRRSILVGTTNEQEILADPTGNRRFWVIPVKGIIPVDLVIKERDKLWAAAYALYKTGEKWFLTPKQEEEREELNKQFQVVDPWTQSIQDYVKYKDSVVLSELCKVLDIEVAKQDGYTAKRINAVMSYLGWETERKRIGGNWVRTWFKTNQKVEKVTGSSGSTGSAFDSAANNTVTTDAYTDSNNCTKLVTISTKTIEVNPGLEVAQNTDKKDTLISGISLVEVVQQELQPIDLQPDPVDPVTFSTFQKNSELTTSPPKQPKKECPRTGLPLPPPLEIVVDGPLGCSVATATSLRYREDNRLQVEIEYSFADGKKRTKQGHVGGKPEVEAIAREEIAKWQNKALLVPSRRYQVRQMADDDYVWVKGCRLTQVQNLPIQAWYVFEAPTGEQLRVRADDEFKLDCANEDKS